MHFSELERLESNQTRQFHIYVNDELWYVEPVEPFYLSTTTIRSGSRGTLPDSDGKLRLWLNNTDSANVPLLINALELYVLTELPQQETNQTDGINPHGRSLFLCLIVFFFLHSYRC